MASIRDWFTLRQSESSAVRQNLISIPLFEQLEPRLLLSGVQAASSAILIDWMGEEVFAYPGQWLLAVENDFGHETDHAAVAQELLDVAMQSSVMNLQGDDGVTGPARPSIVISRELGPEGRRWLR